MKHKKRTPRLRLDDAPEATTISHSDIEYCDNCGDTTIGYRQNHDKHQCPHWPNCAWLVKGPSVHPGAPKSK